MPVTNISLLRSYSPEEPPVNPPPLEPAYVPYYSVLLYMKNSTSSWSLDGNEANNGVFGVDLYRRYYLSDPRSNGTGYYYDTNNLTQACFTFPVLKCVETNSDWKNTLGKLLYPTTSMLPNAATLLENGGGHNTSNKVVVKNTPGFKLGDTSSTTTYADRTAPHGGHVHSVRNLYNSLLFTDFGKYKETYNLSGPSSDGFWCYEVDTVIRDPKLAKKTEKLYCLPKNIIVFGEDLPTEYFTRTHPTLDDETRNPDNVDTDAFPILAKFNPNAVGGSSSIVNRLVSNTAGIHTHTITNKSLSTVTGQTSFTFVDAGNHSHNVTYLYETYLKSKKLKTWITLSANTPLSNGVIIAYSNGVGSNYDGNMTTDAILPPYWHFCDGDNGTPDLRDYYILMNFGDEDHDVVYDTDSYVNLYNIVVDPAGDHDHYSPTATVQNGTPITSGGHGPEPSLVHTHGISAAISFKVEGVLSPVTNIKIGATFDYTPPTAKLAFIMYNENIP